MKFFYLFLLIAVISTLSIGCGTSKNPHQPEEALEENPKFSYLALGDSYTIGESVEVSQRWPAQLTERLKERGYSMAAPKIIAQTGWTTGDLIVNMNQELEVQRDFDIVSLSIGVNNQYQNKPLSIYEEELRELFRKAINHSKKREAGVFAISIPDYGVTPFGALKSDTIGRDIDEFNAVFRRVAEDFNVVFYNITPISRRAGEETDLIAEDDLHPSGLMYQYWVDEIITEVAEKLPQQ